MSSNLNSQSYNLPWVEKYRPKNMDQIIGQDKIINSLENMFKNGSFPHMLFYGGSGSGKTSTILSIIDQYFGNKKKLMVMKLDASDDRGINSVRDEIKGFAEKKNYFNSGIKVIILDEADSMTFDAQFALRRIMEKYSEKTRFCLICNYENKIISAIKSRCIQFKFSPISKIFVINKLQEITKKENIKISKKVLETINDISKGDLRKAINLLQSISIFEKCNYEDLCYQISGFPKKKEIKLIIKYLIDKNITFTDACNKISKIVFSNGYSISVILNELTFELMDYLDYFDSMQLSDIFTELASIENKVAKSTFGDIYLSMIIAIFKKN
jgi:replication factor C subunit 3/5